jgi:hypothetical protein
VGGTEFWGTEFFRDFVVFLGIAPVMLFRSLLLLVFPDGMLLIAVVSLLVIIHGMLYLVY